MRHWILALGTMGIGLFGLLGCTKSSPAPAAATAPANSSAAAGTAAQPAQQPIAVPANAAPEQVVQVFLTALRTGDSPTTESLLTAKARVELAKHQMHVDVQAAPNAIYQVEKGAIVPNEPTVAHVNSLWTEKFENEQGQPVEEKYAIVWGLRHQPEGWRVAGMQVELVPGLRQYLDFEQPEDMMKKRDEALAAMQPPAAQPGVATPGAIQPGAIQPAVAQPSTLPPAGQPGTVPAGPAFPADAGPAAQTAQQPQFPPAQQIPQRVER
jgi:hypothetical protein